ncbi:MAG: FAD-binding protein, partial [Planctomycetales bacterium]|nr:FAD-binding protein [Planctomycetales bacterium]
KLAEVESALTEHGQFMPFDPPLVQAGATLGGTVAAGLSGPGRQRYGGIRDFILGIRLVTGEGQIVFGGGKVVKNAAGFDIPKLAVGSLGSIGIFVELTFKVFPQPDQFATLQLETDSLDDALAVFKVLRQSQYDLTCLDFRPPHCLFVRIGGRLDSLKRRMDRIMADLDLAMEKRIRMVRINEDAEQQLWSELREFGWAASGRLVKLPLVPSQIGEVEDALASLPTDVPRHYSVGGNVVWLAWPASLSLQKLAGVVARVGQRALMLGNVGLTDDAHLAAIPASDETWIGKCSGAAFERALNSVFDPQRKFVY